MSKKKKKKKKKKKGGGGRGLGAGGGRGDGGEQQTEARQIYGTRTHCTSTECPLPLYAF